MSDTQKFKICLTMAGAVSAGAFTAGVMDYLLETLELWEKAKIKNKLLGIDHPDYDFSIPMHEVEIDVISGSSAGGISGSLTMLNVIDGDFKPFNKDNPLGKNNRFFESWVEMGDDSKSTTFEKMLSNDDIIKGEKPNSLLNSQAIDGIANKALTIKNLRPYPSYISDSFDLILTTTNLRGINFRIDFGGNEKSGSVITSHAGFFRYKLANNLFPPGIPDGDELYYSLNLGDPKDMAYLKEATLSTAAFPIGLKSREVAISQKYVERYPKYLFGKRTGIYPILKDNPVYKFNSIDGGLINNEPFAIALKVLKEKNAMEVLKDRYAVIMIDPFPNKDNDIADENPARDIISIAKGMFKALRNQVMFNQDGILEALDQNNRTKYLIEPVRKVLLTQGYVRTDNDLASAPFSGFAGFLDKSFRYHDYQLGRQNCQSFLRYYFGIPQPDISERLTEYPTESAFTRFSFNENQGEEKSMKLFPIIPDMRVLHAATNKYDTDTYGIDAQLGYPDYPSISQKDFERRFKSLLKNRIEAVTNALVGNIWFSIANRLFIRGKIYNQLESAIISELKDSGLMK
ncbi:MAG: patatin-like phospholipase family protein [Flavobacterium sp.]